MGMAASQARFLQLTARRTNIEYMGQQINQQRLALANASAGLFEKMLTLVPPTPPSSQDDRYYKQGYTFTDSRDEVSKGLSWDTYYTMETKPTIKAITVSSASAAPITINATALNAANISTLTTSVAAALGVDTSKNSAGYRQEIKLVTIDHQIYDPDGKYKTVTEQTPALLEFDNLNRLIGATLLDHDMNSAEKDTTQPKYVEKLGDGGDFTYGGVFDNVTYQDDVNKYEFSKSSYDYQIERINQETRIIQTQDKSLELKMKQLDTEHNAVQTEMDAVQKVLQKNIEGSFKTFA